MKSGSLFNAADSKTLYKSIVSNSLPVPIGNVSTKLLVHLLWRESMASITRVFPWYNNEYLMLFFVKEICLDAIRNTNMVAKNKISKVVYPLHNNQGST